MTNHQKASPSLLAQFLLLSYFRWNMQKRIIDRLCNPWLKLAINFRFLMLLTLVVFLQQLSFSSLHHSLGFIDSYAAVTEARFTEKIPAHHQNDHLTLDIEVETAEEDEVQHLQDHSSGCIPKSFCIEDLHYTSFLKTRYLRSVNNKHNWTDLPLFILHHSWKSDLA